MHFHISSKGKEIPITLEAKVHEDPPCQNQNMNADICEWDS